MALLAAAGLLRPEAWVLAGLYWLWCLHGRNVLERLGLLALVVAAPGGWALVDWLVTDDPLFSLHGTQALAELLGRERGIENVPSALVTFLADVARPPVAVAGVLGIVLAVRRFGWSRMAVPLALLGAGVLTFVATGIAGLSIIQRYLTVPAVALCVLAGFALLGFTTLDPARGASAGAPARSAGLVLGVGVPRAQGGELRAPRRRAALHPRDAHRAADAAGRRQPRHAELRAADVPDLPARPRCALDPRRRPGAGALARRGPAPWRARRVHRRGCTVEDAAKFARRFGRADGVSRTTNEPPRRPPDLRSGPFAVYVTQRC